MAETQFDRSGLQQVIAVINGKGGIGKTTLTANCGGLLAESGWRVLLVDLDGQGNLGIDLGFADTDLDDDGQALGQAITFGSAPKVLKNVRPNLDVLPGGQYVERASSALVPEIGKSGEAGRRARLSLASTLAQISDDYDIILLDCPPNSDALQSLAVAAARYILIPAKTDAASLKGLRLTERRLDQVLDINPDLDLLGVVVFASTQSATRVRAEFIEEVADLLGENTEQLVFQSYVVSAEATARAARKKGLLVHELDAKVRSSDAPKWYEALKLGKKVESPGPSSSRTVADSLEAVTQELVARFTERVAEADGEQEAAHV